MKLLVLSLALIVTTGLAQAQILNGGFESGTGNSADDWTLLGAANAVPYAVYLNFGGSNPGPGLRALVFNNGEEPGGNTATQSFTTVPGTIYNLDLIYGNFGASQTQILTATIFDGVSVIATSSFTDFTGDTDFATLYQPGSLTFTALSTTTTLVLGDAGSGTVSSDLLVDSVSITPVPEPASMAVLGLGLAALKRRRKNG